MSRRLLLLLRVGWSAACIVACLLLIALWVRSYWVIEGVGRGSRTPTETTLVSITSNHGTLAFARLTVPARLNLFADVTKGWTYETARPEFAVNRRFFWRHTTKEFKVQFPTWLPAIYLAGVAAVPWMEWKWKKTICALLIVATITAATALAIVVWL